MKNRLGNYLIIIILFVFIPNLLWAQSFVNPSVQFDARLHNAHYLQDSDSLEIYMLLTAKADSLPPNQSPTPLNISLVLDRSGSMSGAKLNYAREAAKFIIDNLKSTDYISIIAYDHQVQVMNISTNAKKKKKLKKIIDNIYHAGATNLSGGMLEGFKQVKRTFKKGYVNRVLLLSDGYANKGITEPFKLQDTVQHINRWHNLTLSTVGLGADFDEDLMEGLGNFGGGNYYFVASAKTVTDIFKQELERMQAVVGQNMEMKLEFPSKHLTLEKVYAYPYLLDSNKITIPLSDIFAEEEKTVLLKFKTKASPEIILDFDASLIYSDIIHSNDSILQKKNLKITETNDEQVVLAKKDTIVQKNIVLFKANVHLGAAISAVDSKNFAQARKIVNDNQNYLETQFQLFTPDTSLLQQYKSNEEYLKKINEYEKYTEYKQKMMQKYAKSTNYMIRKKW